MKLQLICLKPNLERVGAHPLRLSTREKNSDALVVENGSLMSISPAQTQLHHIAKWVQTAKFFLLYPIFFLESRLESNIQNQQDRRVHASNADMHTFNPPTLPRRERPKLGKKDFTPKLVRSANAEGRRCVYSLQSAPITYGTNPPSQLPLTKQNINISVRIVGGSVCGETCSSG